MEAKNRPCLGLGCTVVFWSEGAWHRKCTKCARRSRRPIAKLEYTQVHVRIDTDRRQEELVAA